MLSEEQMQDLRDNCTFDECARKAYRLGMLRAAEVCDQYVGDRYGVERSADAIRAEAKQQQN